MIDIGSSAASTLKGEVYFPLRHLKEGFTSKTVFFFFKHKRRKWFLSKRNKWKCTGVWSNVIFSGNHSTFGCHKVASFQYQGKTSSSINSINWQLKACYVPCFVWDTLHAWSHHILVALFFSLNTWENLGLERRRVQSWNIFKSILSPPGCLPQMPATAALSLHISYSIGKMSSQPTSRPIASYLYRILWPFHCLFSSLGNWRGEGT